MPRTPFGANTLVWTPFGANTLVWTPFGATQTEKSTLRRAFLGGF